MAPVKFVPVIVTTMSVLAVPSKRFDRPLLGYLTRPEVDAVLEQIALPEVAQPETYEDVAEAAGAELAFVAESSLLHALKVSAAAAAAAARVIRRWRMRWSPFASPRVGVSPLSSGSNPTPDAPPATGFVVGAPLGYPDEA